MAETSPADKILALAGGKHQDVLGALEDQQAKNIVQAYRQARSDLKSEITSIYQKTFAQGVQPTPAQMVQMVRSTELTQAIDSHLDDLGVKVQALQGSAFSKGAELGLEQVNAELQVAIDDFGGPGIVGRSTFGSLDTVAHDLGMTAAINDTQNLSNTLRSGIHRELTAGAIAGEGVRDIIKRIDAPDLLGGATVKAGPRAELITRWSVIKGHNAARDQAINDAAQLIPGLQEEWITSRDERVCPHCLAHHGEVRAPDEEFDSARTFAGTPPKVYGGVLEYPPLHPRCRCTIVAWHPRWQGLTSLSPEVLQAQAQSLARSAGFAPKTFPTILKPPSGLRATRAGRQALRAKHIASIPDSVRDAHLRKFRTCWLGGIK